MKVPRGHVGALPDGTEVKLGVFLSNSKSRRAKLTVDKLAALASLGLEWAATMELCARLQPFQNRYDQAVAAGDAARLTEACAGKHGRWGRICALPEGHETSMEEPHWGRNSEGRPIAWVGSAPDDW